MVTKVNLGVGTTFDLIYSPKRLVVTDGKRDWEFLEKDAVRLWRYVPVRAQTIPAYAYWSELETRHSELAAEATGITEGQCVWRAEWTFPIADAIANVDIGDKRFSGVGAIREYNNNFAVPADHLTWTRMLGAKPRDFRYTTGEVG